MVYQKKCLASLNKFNVLLCCDRCVNIFKQVVGGQKFNFSFYNLKKLQFNFFLELLIYSVTNNELLKGIVSFRHNK